jgi:hypothetical protein
VNVKQRALDQALKEINKHSDIQLELEFTGAGSLSEGAELRFSDYGEKTCEKLGG